MANTDAAPAPATETAAEAPSTGNGITVDRARSVLQNAYARSRGEGEPASMAVATEAVDTPASVGGQSAPSPAPSEPAPAPSKERPARPSTRTSPPDQREAPRDEDGPPAAEEAQAAVAEPPSPPSESEPSDEGEASAERPAVSKAGGKSKAAAVLDQEEFQSEAWQRAFQARPDLRRTVPGIVLNANLTPAQQATQLHLKLEEGLGEAQAQVERQENLRALREVNPAAYVDYQKQQEAEQAQLDLLTRQATLVLAAAGADPDDPAFLDAGPKEGEGYEVGLERLGDFLVTKGDRVRQHLETQRAEWDKQKAAEITALKAQFEKDRQAAVEQALAQARSPFGRFQPPPRATGNGVVPVGGAEEGRAPAPSAPDMRNPTLAIRGALEEGYRRRGG